MGLDLLVSNGPLPGHEAEFWSTWSDWMTVARKRPGQVVAPKPSMWQAMIGRQPKVPTQEERAARLQQISQPAYLTMGAPVVGRDPQADDWAREKAGEDGPSHMQGYHVLALLPKTDGLPIYTNAGMYQGPDETSFRGQFLDDCKAVLDEMDIIQAWGAMTAPELGDWGDGLRARAAAYARQAGVAEVIGRRDAPEDIGTPASAAHIADSCGRWARHWADRGHGCEPYF